MKNCEVIDLFCGVGGLTHGFIQQKFRVVAGYDLDPSCRYAFETNNTDAKFICQDIHKIDRKELDERYSTDATKILIGCAPCQPFSSYTNGQDENKKNWRLLEEFLRLIKDVQPTVVSMENVPRLETFKEGNVLKNFTTGLEENGYHVSVNKVFCPNYGIPQTRTRLVLLASRLGPVQLIPPTHQPQKYRTVQDVIGSNLSEIAAGEADPEDPLHIASSLSEKNLKRIRHSTPGGTWRDWPDELVADCHKKSTGRSFIGVYGRMAWDKPAPTITTQCNGFGNGRFGHPEQNRAISLREAALLQTFPATYQFIQPDTPIIISHIAKHIGNAVPVKLAEVIAQSIREHLEGQHND